MASNRSAGKSSGIEAGRDSKQGDRNKQIKYSLKRTAKYISYATIGKEAENHIRRELNEIYNGISDGVADGIAIEKGDTIYVVDPGKDSGGVTFGVRKRIKISNKEKRKIYINNINKESYENGYGDRTIFEKLGIELDKYSGSNVGRQSPKDNKFATKKSTNQKRRVFDGDGDRGRLKYSLKDTAEQEILSHYGKPYRWSETGYINKKRDLATPSSAKALSLTPKASRGTVSNISISNSSKEVNKRFGRQKYSS